MTPRLHADKPLLAYPEDRSIEHERERSVHPWILRTPGEPNAT